MAVITYPCCYFSLTMSVTRPLVPNGVLVHVIKFHITDELMAFIPSSGVKALTYGISQEICTRFCCALLCCGYAIVHKEST